MYAMASMPFGPSIRRQRPPGAAIAARHRPPPRLHHLHAPDATSIIESWSRPLFCCFLLIKGRESGLSPGRSPATPQLQEVSC